jgi:hypothetical protein
MFMLKTVLTSLVASGMVYAASPCIAEEGCDSSSYYEGNDNSGCCTATESKTNDENNDSDSFQNLKYCSGITWGAPAHCCCPDECDVAWAESLGLYGVWFPEGSILFKPFMADPRQITSSVGWRFNDQVLEKNIIDVSYGDYIPLYRFFDIWPCNAVMQIELVGALWAVFDPLHDSSPLIDADYYVGVHFDFAWDRLTCRFRGYHISTHIGDEFLLNHPYFDRRNPSIEVVDFFASYYFTDDIRLYGGVGYIVGEDESFSNARFNAAAGLEVHLHGMGYTDCKNMMYGEPFLAAHFRYCHDFDNHPVDQTYVLGWEWGKLCGLCRKVRIFIEYHDGYSLEGQFCKEPTNYFSIRASYGF